MPVRNIGPTFTEYDSNYGKKLKSNFKCIRIILEFRMQFSTNLLGFRRPEQMSYPHRFNLFLGDSFTLGYGVNDGEK